MNAVIVLYTHIEGYPPSLNATQMLAQKFERVTIVHRNVMDLTWEFPPHVFVVTNKEFCHYSEVAQKSAWWKIRNFVQFTWLFYRQVRRERPSWIIIHEPVAMLSWYLIRPWLASRPKTWYHNHDLISGNENFFFYWAYKAQKKLFPTFNKFSLPSNERKEYFPMATFRGTYHFIPNFPGRYLYDRFYRPRRIDTIVRLVYQGFICPGHGLEEILLAMKEGILPRHQQLKLVLKGFRDEAFVDRLMKQAEALGIAHDVELHGVTSYLKVPEVASGCHIGIGVHTKTDSTNKTLGTASNKIYEYAALGLPVILFDNPHFRSHLGVYSWASFTDLTPSNLKDVIRAIVYDYDARSRCARRDFEDKLNFEAYFDTACADLT